MATALASCRFSRDILKACVLSGVAARMGEAGEPLLRPLARRSFILERSVCCRSGVDWGGGAAPAAVPWTDAAASGSGTFKKIPKEEKTQWRINKNFSSLRHFPG